MCTMSSLDDQALVISGRVKGTYRDDYEVTVYLASSRSGAVTAYRSQCSCPVAQDCKHAAAVLIVARHLAAAAQAVERPEWEKALDKLMAGAPLRRSTSRRWPWSSGSSASRRSAATSAGRTCGSARPASARAVTGCGAGSAGTIWTSSPGRTCPSTGSCCCSSGRPPGPSARYALPRSAWLSLGAVGSGFWGLLDQTGPTGLSLITAQPLRGPAPARGAGHGAAWTSAGSRPAASSSRPRVIARGPAAAAGAVGVLGEPAHGVFWLRPGEAGTEELDVARLTDARPRAAADGGR